MTTSSDADQTQPPRPVSDEPEPEAPRPPALPDTDSDPAHDDGAATDWSTEGGATPTGPATEADRN